MTVELSQGALAVLGLVGCVSWSARARLRAPLVAARNAVAVVVAFALARPPGWPG